jgi:hypothetical protein
MEERTLVRNRQAADAQYERYIVQIAHDHQ